MAMKIPKKCRVTWKQWKSGVWDAVAYDGRGRSFNAMNGFKAKKPTAAMKRRALRVMCGRK